jgi:hypothetical protein
VNPRRLALVAALAIGWLAEDARGEQAASASSSPAEVVSLARAALDQGDLARALRVLEASADKGQIHPDLSFNRGLAYTQRARGPGAEPGDLGRAAAGFEETLRLRPDDVEARQALDAVRAVVAKRRARLDQPDVIVRPSLDRALARLLSPNGWAALATLLSATLGLGLVLRSSSARARHVAGDLLVVASLFGLTAATPAAFFARWLATSRAEGVVVAPELTLVDRNGKAIAAPTVPEAARVELGPAMGDERLVRWGSYEGLAPRDAVRPLAR